MEDREAIKEQVREHYARQAERVRQSGGKASCCGDAAASCGDAIALNLDPITSNLYDSSEASAIPEEAVVAFGGRRNPTVLARLNPGETVLDLGSGGGIDVPSFSQTRWSNR